jgi:hypothetical protein
MSLQRSFKYGKRAAYGIAVAAILFTTTTGSMAVGRSLIEGCATRDAQIIMMLESSSVSARHMNHALHTIMHAREMVLRRARHGRARTLRRHRTKHCAGLDGGQPAPMIGRRN